MRLVVEDHSVEARFAAALGALRGTGPDAGEDPRDEVSPPACVSLYGPNGARVEAHVLERARQLTVTQKEALARAWGFGGAANTNEDHARVAARKYAQRVAWSAVGESSRAAACDNAAVSAQAATADPGSVATAAAKDACAALIVEDFIERKRFEALYGPWAEVFGWPPAL